MNSRQVNFYMTSSDQDEVECVFLKKWPHIVVDSISNESKPKLLGGMSIQSTGNERLKIYLALQVHFEKINLMDLSSQNYKYIDDLRSPVIEFYRCYQDNQVLQRGRMYFNSKYFDGELLLTKDSEFLDWASLMFKTLKKALIKDPASFFYYGKEALRLKREAAIRFE